MKQLNRVRVLVLFAAAALIGLPAVGGCKGDTAKQSGKKKFYIVQPIRNHPVHQLTQAAFKEGCDKLGYAMEVVGTEDMNAPGTVALAEQVLAKGDAAGMLVWATDPAFYPLIAEAGRQKIPTIIAHFPVRREDVPGLTGLVSCDPAEYARAAAVAIGEQIKQRHGGKGAVAITQGAQNVTEDLVSAEFTKTLKEKFPEVKVLPPDLEGFNPPLAIAKAASILRANPDVVAAITTTSPEPPTWPAAAVEVGRPLINISMNYVRPNLEAVRDGTMHAFVAQPLWEESYKAAELLDKAARGEQIEFFTKMPAPLVTKDNLAPYFELMDKVDAARKK